MFEVEQVYYSNYSQKLKPEHKNYWADIENIARLISLHLEYYETKFYSSSLSEEFLLNSTNKRTTIVVGQHKEKFGSVRVYWTPADPMFVDYKYNTLSDVEKEKITLEDYREICYKQDIIHYRNTYHMFIEMFPQYKEAIVEGADNPEYLYYTKEEYLSDAKTSEFLQERKEEVFKVLDWKVL